MKKRIGLLFLLFFVNSMLCYSSLYWYLRDSTLYIYGSGTMDEFASPNVPWESQKK